MTPQELREVWKPVPNRMNTDTLREKCETFAEILVGERFDDDVDLAMSFAVSIWNAAIEEAAKITAERCGTSTIAVKEIRALKESQ